jgi:hypothetical protein
MYSSEEITKISEYIIEYITYKYGKFNIIDNTLYNMSEKGTIIEIQFDLHTIINYNIQTKKFIIIDDYDFVIDESEKFNKFLRKYKIKKLLSNVQEILI